MRLGAILMSMTDINSLYKTVTNKRLSLEESKKYNATKQKINNICQNLAKGTQNYEPKITVSDIMEYISSNVRLERILYSEISNYVFSLDKTERGILATNIENLLLYALNKELGTDCQKLIIKLYDHVQLALYQIENANNIFANSIENAKENLQKQIKSVEREYISILGIFAAIVLAFVGGMTFSTSVLQHIADVSIFRLLLISDFIALVMVNAIYILMKFIFIINNKETIGFNINKLNMAFGIIALLIVLAWIIELEQLREYIAHFMPWYK